MFFYFLIYRLVIKSSKEEVVTDNEEEFFIIKWGEMIQIYYSEILLLVLSILQLMENPANGIILLLVSLIVMILNSLRRKASDAFHDIDYIGEAWNNKIKSIINLDCIEDASVYCIPLILNAVAVIWLNEGLTLFHHPYFLASHQIHNRTYKYR
jgi:hypothetical protein